MIYCSSKRITEDMMPLNTDIRIHDVTKHGYLKIQCPLAWLIEDIMRPRISEDMMPLNTDIGLFGRFFYTN